MISSIHSTLYHTSVTHKRCLNRDLNPLARYGVGFLFSNLSFSNKLFRISPEALKLWILCYLLQGDEFDYYDSMACNSNQKTTAINDRSIGNGIQEIKDTLRGICSPIIEVQ